MGMVIGLGGRDRHRRTLWLRCTARREGKFSNKLIGGFGAGDRVEPTTFSLGSGANSLKCFIYVPASTSDGWGMPSVFRAASALLRRSRVSRSSRTFGGDVEVAVDLTGARLISVVRSTFGISRAGTALPRVSSGRERQPRTDETGRSDQVTITIATTATAQR